MISFILSLFLAVAVVLPVSLGVFLLTVPSHRLAAQYMDMRHRWSSFAPLKDEHFRYVPRLVAFLKGTAFLLIALGAAAAFFAFELGAGY